MKTMLDLSDIVIANEWVQDFVVKRYSYGKLVKGRFSQTESTVPMSGTVSAVNEKDLEMIPEGDRNKESRTFYSIKPLYITRQDGNNSQSSGTSDIIVYNGFDYKVITVVNADDYGYYKAIAVKISAGD